MAKVICLIFVLSALILLLEYPALAFDELKSEKKEVNNFRNQLLSQINYYRQDKNLNSLTLDPCLNKVAQEHSEWMYATGTFSHIGKNGSSFQQRCIDAGCDCDAETIFSGSDVDAKNCFEIWLKSPEHRDIILGNHTRIGIGIAYGWVTVVFY
jgi:uncharacterized protein YkwD